MRIVSLLPAATEIVCALGLRRQLVGVSHACDWPPEIVGRPVVTRSTLGPPRRGRSVSHGRSIDRRVRAAAAAGIAPVELDAEVLRSVRPDLIITQSTCALCAPDRAAVEAAARSLGREVSIISLEPSSVDGVLNAIATVGAMTETERRAIDLVGRLRRRLARIETRVERARSAGRRPLRVVALEWLDPPMSAGHWVPEQIRRAGGWDVLGREGEPAARTTWRTIADVDPDMLLLMPCGFDLAGTVRDVGRLRRPAAWSTLRAVEAGAVIAFDGSAYFSRPGPRLIDGIGILAEVFDPESFIDVAPPLSWEPVPA